MQAPSDVVVIGSGLAGLTAAIACAECGCNVTVACNGQGIIAISSGCIDLLGVIEGKVCDDPWAAMAKLPSDHPYSLIGQDNVRKALDAFEALLAKYHAPFCVNTANGERVNTLVPTILGTVKPSYLIPKSADATILYTAKRALVCGVAGLRDISPKLCQMILSQHPMLSHTRIEQTTLPSPFPASHRGITALDIARHVNTENGQSWLLTCLGRFAHDYDVIMLPPILGTSYTHGLCENLSQSLGCQIRELISIPPGVGGIRLREILLKEATAKQIRFVENCKIDKADIVDTHCQEVFASDHGVRLGAKAFVLATGGILGGGIQTDPTTCTEPLFRFPIPNATTLPRCDTNALGNHLINRLGVSVDATLRALDADGTRCLDNVFVAGRTLGGYDFTTEKSGHGVAIASGWYAGIQAAHSIGMGAL
ncbi:MAG: anaerobic glycerol-3-phosphate dehydrogenase subunit B [Desulfovibrio sp.]|nr:anaerobic glycerol-3-phosphate dehydrogenase subunit B [Desulfovibrio sp.]